MAHSRRRRQAFTLIELLVVIAIVALLVSILLPSLRRARGLAQQAVCATNLRTIGSAAWLYVEDNDEAFPYTLGRAQIFGDNPNPRPAMNPNENGLGILDYYYVQSPGAFDCPSAAKARPDYNPQKPYSTYNSAFGVNNAGVFGYDNASLWPPVKLSDIAKPMSRLLATDASRWIELRNRQLPTSQRFAQGRHGGGTGLDGQADVCFVDTHVESQHTAWFLNNLDEDGTPHDLCPFWK